MCYMIKADDGDGNTDTVTVEIVTAAPTAEPTVAPTEVPTATPEPPGFEAAFAIAGMLAIAYLVLRKRRE